MNSPSWTGALGKYLKEDKDHGNILPVGSPLMAAPSASSNQDKTLDAHDVSMLTNDSGNASDDLAGMFDGEDADDGDEDDAQRDYSSPAQGTSTRTDTPVVFSNSQRSASVSSGGSGRSSVGGKCPRNKHAVNSSSSSTSSSSSSSVVSASPNSSRGPKQQDDRRGQHSLFCL